MEPKNHFGFYFNNIHQNLPIRRFSQAARVEEHHHLHDQAYPPPMVASVDSMEECLFVDSFFNVDHNNSSEGDSLSSSEENHRQPFDSFLEEVDLDLDLDTFLMPDDDKVDGELPEISEQPVAATIGVDGGLQLVHLLLACAEAVGCRDTQLAGSILTQIWCSANPLGDSLQRVSYCFATGLKSRLSLLCNNINANGTISMSNSWQVGKSAMDVTREERIEAFHLLHQTTPYIHFGFMAANEAIIQAALGKDHVHIIDLGMEHVLQWPSLIRTLASTNNQEVLLKLIRITGIVGEKGEIAELESGMTEMVAEANSLGINLGFRLIAGPATPAMLTRENLGLKEGEALFVNSMLHLHTYVKESRGSLKTILQSIKKLGPTLLTVVEQDANHNGPFFLGRFVESLHYYSAIFDSLEASMGRNSVERMKIERNHFAEEIRNIVAYEGTERVERHERADQWRRQLGRAGFQVVAGKERQATVMNGCDGYTVGNDQKGYLLLGWKGRPIMVASAWQPSF